MRIAIVLNKFPVLTETFIVNQIISLIDDGHDVSIFSLKKGSIHSVHNSIKKYKLLEKVSFLEEEPSNKISKFIFFIRFLIINIGKYSFLKVLQSINVFRYKKEALSLHIFYKNQWFLNQDFDIIHAHFASVGLYVARLHDDGFFKKSKLVTSFHGSDIIPKKAEYYKINYSVLFKKMDLITYNSAYTLEILKGLTKVNNKFKILPVGLDTALFKSDKKQSNDVFEIVFCGRLVPFKAPNLAVEIVNCLVNNGHNVHLTIIGEGKLLNQIEKMILQYKLRKQVSLLGGVNQEKIIDCLAKADAFLLPGITEKESGRAENQGLVIQEAQAMKVPVIVSNAGGMKYGLLDNKTGFVVNESDILGFVEKIEVLINNEEFRTRMGKSGRRYVKENFDSKVLTAKLIKNYYTIINENSTH